MPKLTLDDAAEASACSVIHTDQGLMICFHDEAGVIFAYALLAEDGPVGRAVAMQEAAEGIGEAVGHA